MSVACFQTEVVPSIVVRHFSIIATSSENTSFVVFPSSCVTVKPVFKPCNSDSTPANSIFKSSSFSINLVFDLVALSINDC